LRKASIFLVPVLVGGALLIGCGGGDDSSSTEAALTKSAYLKQGNAICKNANDDLDVAAKQQFGNQQPTQKELEQFATSTAIPELEQEIADLRALPAPTGDTETVSAIYDAAESGLDQLKQDPSIITQDNPQAFAEANKLAKDYGLTVCAS
jgi:hypothetical protein